MAMKSPINNLFEALIKSGKKLSREDFYEMNVEKSMTVVLTSAEVSNLKRMFSKYFNITQTQIIMK